MGWNNGRMFMDFMPRDDCFGNEDIFSKQKDRLFVLLCLRLELMDNRIMDNEDHHDDFIIRLENEDFL